MAQEHITMTNKEWERYKVIQRLIQGEINGTEASKQLGLSTRQIRRIKAKVKKREIKGIIHGNRGKPSNSKTPKEKEGKIKEIIEENYHDFGPTLTSEKLDENHGIKICNETLRGLMTGWGLWVPRPRRKNKEYRAWRPRKDQYGEMEQFDGSYHAWFEDRASKCCLLASIDDATGNLTKLQFTNWEGVVEAFIFWKEYVETKGKPLKIYLDRHSTYKQIQKTVVDDPNAFTQFQRAIGQDLGIEIVHAYSAPAKGRVERLFRTLQDRLIKELRIAGISTIEEANKFANEHFLPRFNAKFAVVAKKKGNLHRPLTKLEKKNLDKIFSKQKYRVVANDFTVRHEGKYYQLLASQPTTVYRKDKVLMEERINGEMFISLRSKYLAYKVLPARPPKIKMRVTALVRTKPAWKPPADHPWRKPYILKPDRTGYVWTVGRVENRD